MNQQKTGRSLRQLTIRPLYDMDLLCQSSSLQGACASRTRFSRFSRSLKEMPGTRVAIAALIASM
ncbi:MAG: hypothetical protein AAGF04_03425 [Chlamydiota bacterium]